MKTLYSFVVILLLCSGNLFAGDIDVSSLPKILGSSNVGKEFYFTFIPSWESAGKCDIKLYISSNVKTKVTIEVEGKGYSKTQSTIPNDIIEFTLVPSIGQAYRKSPWEPPEIEQVWRSASVHVIADDPIICYGVTRYQYTSDAFLALPVNVLGKEYIVASFGDVSANDGQWLPSYTGITAPYNKTKVFFTMGGTDSSKTAGNLLPGQTSEWTLNQGDVLLIASKGQHAELTGSKIVASKPVSVVSGNFCAYIPIDCGCCDFITEMEMPTHSWGQTYHVSPIIGRKKTSIIKIFAKEDNTVIYKDHNQIGIIRKGGGVEGTGYLHMRADTSSPRPVVISGEKPISVTQYNTSQLDDDVVGDPFQMLLLPVEQYQKEVTFNTPGIRGGFGFPYNYINLCYESDTFGNIPDDLEIAIYDTKDSVFDWYKLKDTLGKNGTPFANYEFGKQYSSMTFLLPGDGVYKLKADKPLQAYSYGFSWCDSYGHPASVSLKRLDIIDTLPPKTDWVMDCYGNVNSDTVIYVKDKPDEIANRSNIAMINLRSNESYNYKLVHDDFIACADTAIAWRLEVIDNREDAFAVVTFADCAGNDTTIIIQYNALKVAIEPEPVEFNTYDIPQKIDKLCYLVNKSETSSEKIKSVFLKQKDVIKNNQGFSLFDSSGLNPLPLEFDPWLEILPLDAFPLMVRFEASKEGEFFDSIGITCECGSAIWYIGSLMSGVGAPIIEVSDWNFPPTMVGSTAYGSFDIKNIGTVSLEIYDYVGPFITGNVHGQKIYSSDELEDMNITPSTPLRLKPKESRTFQVKFMPDEQKSFPDSIVFMSNSVKNPQYNNGNPIDSVTRFDGSGMQSQLIASGYNWERKRIHRPNFPAGPYPAVRNEMNPDTAIRLYNGGTAAVNINRLIYTNVVGDTSAFHFVRKDLLRTLNPGEEIIVPVTFQPTQTGPCLLTFRFETNPAIQNVYTTLQGIGIVPKIETRDIDFGATSIGDENNYSTRKMTIRNLSLNEWQYGDSVTITDFSEVDINPDIVRPWDSYPEAFRYDNHPSVLPFPIKLAPGDSLTFDAEFVAKGTGLFTASLTTVSDAEMEVTSNWRGYDSSYVDVEDNSERRIFSVFPNPSQGTIQISYLIESAGIVNIYLTDILGNQMLLNTDYKFPGDYTETYNLNDYPQGIYNLILQINDKIYSESVVVMK
ncbi:MAG: T9SS type A sorting domain-containing protein [bacterium]